MRGSVRAPAWIVPLARKLKLSEAEAVVLAALLPNGFASRETVDAALRDAGSTVAGPGSNTSSVLASKLAAKLEHVAERVVYGDEQRGVRGWSVMENPRAELSRQAAELGAAGSSTNAVPIEWRLGGAQAVAAELLISGDTLTRSAFAAELTARGLTNTKKSLDVHISRLRDKLTPHGLELDTLVGIGWRFDDNSRKRLQIGVAAAGDRARS